MDFGYEDNGYYTEPMDYEDEYDETEEEEII